MAALALEAILLLLLLTLGNEGTQPAGSNEAMVSFDVREQGQQAEPSEQPETEEQPPSAAEPATKPQPPSEAAGPAPASALPVPRPPAVVIPRLEPPQDFRLDERPRRRPDRPSAAVPATPGYGPAAPSSAGDSEVVGTAPDGEPLYAARWFREPTDQELRGYLSPATPGYALIACKTAPEWRVEACVGLEEYPPNSNLQRAVLAAAWQFQVRPPRRGNRSLVGAWVRIRIDYSRN